MPLLYVYRERCCRRFCNLRYLNFFIDYKITFTFLLRRVLLYLTEIIRFFFFFSLTDMCLLQHNKLVLDLSFCLSFLMFHNKISFLFVLRDVFPSSKKKTKSNCYAHMWELVIVNQTKKYIVKKSPAHQKQTLQTK